MRAVDPFGGSYFIEELTDRMEKGCFEYIEKIDQFGGMVEAIEAGFPQREIWDASYQFQRSIDSGEKLVVGVNAFQTEQEDPYDILYIDESTTEQQITALNRVRAHLEALTLGANGRGLHASRAVGAARRARVGFARHRGNARRTNIRRARVCLWQRHLAVLHLSARLGAHGASSTTERWHRLAPGDRGVGNRVVGRADGFTLRGSRVRDFNAQLKVNAENVDGAWTVTASHLQTKVKSPNADPGTFQKAADGAKAGCPISRLLNTKITLDAQLV